MITEDYVSFETAKLLKEKGFEQIGCTYKYNLEGKLCKGFTYGPVAPTHQMAMKWLRDVHGLAIIIKPSWHEGDMRNPCFWWYEIWGLITTERDYSCEGLGRMTYEKAAEEAIRYCLEKLI